MKKVYIAIGADILHTGHINVIEVGSKYGEVILGILSDTAIASYKRLPVFDYETRKAIFSSLKNVSEIVCSRYN
jgi:phosphoenolpyruvate phosphomutase / 2-hydroxyethylphosphonate cytidylyltransferase